MSVEAESEGEDPWAQLSDEKILQYRICDLHLKMEGSELAEIVQSFYKELENKGLQFKPKVYLGDEWFSPEGVPAIAIPFYLAHPRLKALENKYMLEVEGGTSDWCHKLLRHEAGHCYDHAYQFSKTRRWRQIFGSPQQPYDPDIYRPRPYSRNFVRHLDHWYSQSHPDEDFAETFAVWLTPDCDWRKLYSNWKGAHKKLEYIDEMMKKISNQKPVVTGGPHSYSVSRIKTTLEKYYAKKSKKYAKDYPDFFDSDLREIFNGDLSLPRRSFGAARFMRRNRKIILDVVSRWTGGKKYTINDLLKKFTIRCEEIDLKIGKNETLVCFDVAAYLASLVTHYKFTGTFKRSV